MTGEKEQITGGDFRRMVAGAYNAFLLEHENINQLNVFPVPDGDTGTNMLLTLGAVARAVAEAPETGLGCLSKRAGDSAIMGARGNSGVILAQMFRGIARGLSGKKEADSSEVGKAFQYGVLYAYRAVMRPVEGTILTVAKEIAKGTRRAVRSNLSIYDILETALQAGKAALAQTPEQLPSLKAAGVVDAGGLGFIIFLQGCLEGIGGVFNGPEANIDSTLQMADQVVSRLYCMEFFLRNSAVQAEEMRNYLTQMGDSLLIAAGHDFIKIHLHTDHPGRILETAITWGTVHGIAIDNMADQHRATFGSNLAAKSKVAVISVADGEVMAAAMKKQGAAIIVDGGQAMNPSVAEFLAAIHKHPADQYILLPNSKNIALTAVQTKKLIGNSVVIVPTVSIPQGLAVLPVFSANADCKVNVANMLAKVRQVKTGAIATAVREAAVRQHRLAAGRYIGIIDGQVCIDADTPEEVLLVLVKQLQGPDSAKVALYYGSCLDEQQAHGLVDSLSDNIPELAVALHAGGQAHYHVLLSIE